MPADLAISKKRGARVSLRPSRDKTCWRAKSATMRETVSRQAPMRLARSCWVGESQVAEGSSLAHLVRLPVRPRLSTSQACSQTPAGPYFGAPPLVEPGGGSAAPDISTSAETSG